MNRTECNLSRLILLAVGILLTWVNPLPLNSNIALSQTSLTSSPNVREEPVVLIAVEPNSQSIPPEVKTAVLNDAVKRTSKTVSAMKILEVQQQQWSDGCLGLGATDEICTQAITPGYRVVVTDGTNNWTYRTDNLGNTVRLE